MKNAKKINKILKLIVSLILCQLPGLIGSFFTLQAIPNWYAYLNKPILNPPNWLFAPVWTLIYLSLGISFFLIWQSNQSQIKKKMAYYVFFVQLILNAFWSIFFFGLRSPLLALIEIIFLWIIIAWNIKLFYQLHRLAGLILIPYLLWVTFATYLTFSIFLLN